MPPSPKWTWSDLLRTHIESAPYCIGIDEVGTGALAGPFVVAAVVCRNDWEHVGVRDSKKLSPEARAHLVDKVLVPPAIEDCWVISRDANALKHSKDLPKMLMEMMVEAAMCASAAYPASVLVVDGNHAPKFRHIKSVAVPKADDLVPAVSAASIIAKVYRDHVMRDYGKVYPQYGFAQHVGYGTEQHKKALALHGICPIHRLAYRPVREAAGIMR